MALSPWEAQIRPIGTLPLLTIRAPARKLEPESPPGRTKPSRTGTMDPVKALENHGQAVWLDFLARGFVAKGELKKLIETDGVKGVTSNPAIFEKAIGSSDEYDGDIAKALKKGDRSVADLFEAVAVEDIQNAADVLRGVYDATGGGDGFVSLEVSPYLANDTKGTIAEAQRLWKDVKRKNLMVKVPATERGPAGDRGADRPRHFHQHHAVVLARGLSRGGRGLSCGSGKIRRQGGDPSHVASVASFFVSRIDSAVDKQLDEKIAKANDPTEKERLADLMGKVAIANAKMAYQDYKKLFSGARWEKLPRRAQSRSDCCGPRPAPRTRNIPTSSMSRN